MSRILRKQSLFPWDSGGPRSIVQAGCQASTCTPRHIPSTRSSREANICKFDLTIPRNIFFHCYFPFLPHQLQPLKSHCFLPCATVLAAWIGTQLSHYLYTPFIKTLWTPFTRLFLLQLLYGIGSFPLLFPVLDKGTQEVKAVLKK